MGVYKNGKKLGQPYFNGKKMNAYLNGKKVWLGGPNYVVFQSDEPRTITPKYTNSGITLQYSINGGTSWVNIASGAITPSSKEIWMRGQATGSKSLYTGSNTGNAWAFSGGASNKLKVFGNLNFLLCDNLGGTAAPTTLADYCYSYMFYGCTSLVQAPELPATTLADYCYSYMFYGCTSLVQAPELPATTLAERCYSYMFRGCTLLVQAPELPATTLVNYCYSYMFRECTSLVQAPELPATTLAERCYSYMFRGCTLLVQAPELPATTLAERCYNGMFYGCTSLTSIVLHYPGNDNPNSAFLSWVQGISTTGILYKAGTQFTASGNSTYPATWTQVQI